MKKIFISILFLFTAALFFAHSPSDINLTYNPASKIVSINVVHKIAGTKEASPEKHFVKEITVAVNDKIIITEALTAQQSDDGAISTFLIKVKANDKIVVMAVCNISGTKTAELAVK